MLLKKLYDQEALQAFKEGRGKKPSPIGVQVVSKSPRQSFSPRLIQEGLSEGWLAMAENRIVLKGDGRSYIFEIERPPGVYCCHCGKQLLAGGPAAQEHVKRHRGDSTGILPDPANPAGYRVDNFFACIRAGEEERVEAEEKPVRSWFRRLFGG